MKTRWAVYGLMALCPCLCSAQGSPEPAPAVPISAPSPEPSPTVASPAPVASEDEAPVATVPVAAPLPLVAALVAAPAVPAPMRMPHGAKLFIEPSEFGMALSAALLKKRVGVVGMTDKEKADFFVQTVSNASKEGGGERVTKLLLFGGLAGSGKRFEATVTITNRDGAIVFAHNSKKENFQSAAENIAKEVGKHIGGR